MGALQVASRRIGLSVDQYVEHLEAGEKWCWACGAWHKREAFGMDSTRGAGLEAKCRDSKNRLARMNYKPKQRVKGRFRVPARPGDKRQARRRVNYYVEAGLLPAPNTIPCTDCGHVYRHGGGRRHEYDHYRGYGAREHLIVEVVCPGCHHKRERELRGRPNKN